MGRRDEPKLDELTKLLKRLETMDLAPRQEPSHRPEPEQAKPLGEYVGALRGMPLARGGDDRTRSSFEAKSALSYSASASRSMSAGRSSSATAIVIGATTAAVVSSVIAVSLVLWTNGRGDNDDRRLTFYAPGEPAAASKKPEAGTTTAPTRSTPAASPADAQPLLQQADVHLRNGNPSEAVRLLEKAAQLGSGVAALTLGAMYDPGRPAQFANLALKADPTKARVWYERAKDLGVAEANARLAELAAK